MLLILSTIEGLTHKRLREYNLTHWLQEDVPHGKHAEDVLKKLNEGEPAKKISREKRNDPCSPHPLTEGHKTVFAAMLKKRTPH